MGNIISYQPVRENGELVDIYFDYKKETTSGYVIHSALLSDFLPCGISLAEYNNLSLLGLRVLFLTIILLRYSFLIYIGEYSSGLRGLF